MKKLIPFLVFIPTVAFAGPPFKYQTKCYLENNGTFYEDICTVVETREDTGALKTRNIYSNKWGLTIKGRFDPEKGYMTWDSHNKYEYKWEYKVGGNQETGAWTYVMPGFLLQNVSWD
jgi:predicted dehydrogenase